MRSGASAPQTPASIYLNAARVHSHPPAARTHAQGSALSTSSGVTRPAAPVVRAALTPPAPARLWGLGELIAGFSPKVAVVGDRELEAGARLALLREDVDARRLDGLCRAVQGCSPQVPPPSATAPRRAQGRGGLDWRGRGPGRRPERDACACETVGGGVKSSPGPSRWIRARWQRHPACCSTTIQQRQKWL